MPRSEILFPKGWVVCLPRRPVNIDLVLQNGTGVDRSHRTRLLPLSRHFQHPKVPQAELSENEAALHSRASAELSFETRQQHCFVGGGKSAGLF